MPIEFNTPKTDLSEVSQKRIQRHLKGLERRLVNFHHTKVNLTVKDRPTERRHTADLLVQLGVDGVELVSHHGGESAEHAARLAIEDVERQLERHVANLRGEPAYGTPSRREPRDLRPGAHPAEDETDEDDYDYDAPPDINPDRDNR